MDDAARRVAPRDLRALVHRRQERENAALAEMQAALSRVAQAESDVGRARDAHLAQEAARTEGERMIYDRLGAGGALTPPQLQEQLGALSRLTETVESARRDVNQADQAVIEALEDLAELRERYARCARDAAKWVKIEGIATEARSREAELHEELETEDEVNLRHARAFAPGSER